MAEKDEEDRDRSSWLWIASVSSKILCSLGVDALEEYGNKYLRKSREKEDGWQLTLVLALTLFRRYIIQIC